MTIGLLRYVTGPQLDQRIAKIVHACDTSSTWFLGSRNPFLRSKIIFSDGLNTTMAQNIYVLTRACGTSKVVCFAFVLERPYTVNMVGQFSDTAFAPLSHRSSLLWKVAPILKNGSNFSVLSPWLFILPHQFTFLKP